MTRNGDGMKTENEDAVAHANRCATTTASRQFIEAKKQKKTHNNTKQTTRDASGRPLQHALQVWAYLRVRNSTGLVAVQGCPSLARHVKKRLIFKAQT